MIKVLVVEDSASIREFLCQILASDPAISVIGAVADGNEALSFVARHKPNVVTMDIHMPKMNGVDATRRIMESCPVPIVIVTGSTLVSDVEMTFRAMEAGALTVVARPLSLEHPDYARSAAEFIQTLKLMSEVKVVRRFPKKIYPAVASQAVQRVNRSPSEIRLVAIGASTGGPLVLQTLLSHLPLDFPAPLLIVQHMAEGFMDGFVSWLSSTTGFPVKIAVHGEIPQPGHAYLAPHGFQMGIAPGGAIDLSPQDYGLSPSVSHLFASVVFHLGKHAIGVLLTGMGADGALELKQLKDAGSVTIAQDEATSAVFGMPGAAVRLRGAEHILPAEAISEALVRIVNYRNGLQRRVI